jgi:hypothetical protein
MLGQIKSNLFYKLEVAIASPKKARSLKQFNRAIFCKPYSKEAENSTLSRKSATLFSRIPKDFVAHCSLLKVDRFLSAQL